MLAPDAARIRLAELVALLSLGTDLGLGQPMEHMIRACLIALRLAERLGAALKRGPGVSRALLMTRSTLELGDGEHAVAVSNDLAAGDLRRVGNRRVEVLVGDPPRDDLRGLVGLLGRLEETKRAHDAVAGLDQVIGGETGELAELRDASTPS